MSSQVSDLVRRSQLCPTTIRTDWISNRRQWTRTHLAKQGWKPWFIPQPSATEARHGSPQQIFDQRYITMFFLMLSQRCIVQHSTAVERIHVSSTILCHADAAVLDSVSDRLKAHS